MRVWLSACSVGGVGSSRRAALLLAPLAVFAVGGGVEPATATAGFREQGTQLISRAYGGGLPNGPSTNAVVSADRRFARVIAFESGASDLVRRDTNGKVQDVFLTFRGGAIHNTGARWRFRRTVLVSKTARGRSGNGASFAAAVSGGFHSKPTRIVFLSSATNLARRDTNGKVDAFIAPIRGGGTGAPRRISLPRGRQARADTTAVAISGDGRKVAFVIAGRLYVSNAGRGRPRLIGTRGRAADPSFSTGLREDLVFGAGGGVYLAKNAAGRPRLVGRGGRNPVYNDIKRRVVAYEKTVRGHVQIAYHDIGRRERIISRRGGSLGNADSREPVIGNSGYYVTFESDATNLGVSAGGGTGDRNGKPDVYLYTDTRHITLVQSVVRKAQPLDGGGRHPSMSFYANYVVFDAPIVVGAKHGQPGLRIGGAASPLERSIPCVFPADRAGRCDQPQAAGWEGAATRPTGGPLRAGVGAVCGAAQPRQIGSCLPSLDQQTQAGRARGGSRGGRGGSGDQVKLGEPQVYMRWLGAI